MRELASKRRIIQAVCAALYNADIRGYVEGSISRSPFKRVCVPGLNCYSCPAAVASCPLGALQNGFGAGSVPLFVLGALIAIGALFARLVCGFLCPMGLVQELLYKIKTRKIEVHKSERLLRITRKASLFKYAVLAVLCIALPLALYMKNGIGAPLFCSFLCPAGTFEAGVPLVILNKGIRQAAGWHFAFKCATAFLFAVWSVFWMRPFCVFVCPLGAIYSLFNKIALFGIAVDGTKCTHCGACAAVCKMPTPIKAKGRDYLAAVNDRECIRCGDCMKVCRAGAIVWRGMGMKRPS